MFGFLGDAITSGLGSGISSAIAGKFGGGGDSHSKIFKRQQTWHREQLLNNPGWAVNGLRNAGLNPILAVKNGVSNTATQPPIPQIDTESTTTSARAAAVRAGKEAALLEAQKDKLKAETGKIHEETATETVRRWNIEADTQLKGELKQKTLSQIQQIKNDAWLKAQQRNVAVATEDEIRQRILNLKSKMKLNDQQLQEMFARFPGLLVEKKIDESTYGELLRWVDRSLPSINSASGALGAIGIFRNFKKRLGKDERVLNKRTGEIYDY